MRRWEASASWLGFKRNLVIEAAADEAAAVKKFREAFPGCPKDAEVSVSPLTLADDSEEPEEAGAAPEVLVPTLVPVEPERTEELETPVTNAVAKGYLSAYLAELLAAGGVVTVEAALAHPDLTQIHDIGPERAEEVLLALQRVEG